MATPHSPMTTSLHLDEAPYFERFENPRVMRRLEAVMDRIARKLDAEAVVNHQQGHASDHLKQNKRAAIIAATEARNAVIRDALSQNPQLSNVQIAKMLSTSDTRVSMVRASMGLAPYQQPTSGDKIRKLLAENPKIRASAAAKILKCSVTTVKKYRREMESR